MSVDLLLVPEADGLTYALGAPTSLLPERATNRFLTQFFSIFNAETARGTGFMQAFVSGKVRTNSDVVTLVSTAGAQIRTFERTLEYDIIFESLNILAVEFVDLKTLKITVSLNTTAGSVVNNLLVTV